MLFPRGRLRRAVLHEVRPYDGGNRVVIGGRWRIWLMKIFWKKDEKSGKKFGSFGIFLYLCKWKDEGGESCRMTSKAIFFLFC